MERRVERRHRGQVGQQLAHGADGGDGPRVVQRRQVGDRVEVVDHLVVEPDRLAEPRATVHHPVPDRVEAGPLRASRVGQERAQRIEVTGTVPPLDGVRGDHALVVEHAQLEAARSGVDDQDAHGRSGLGVSRDGWLVWTCGPSPGPHCQSRTSGRSSPCSRM